MSNKIPYEVILAVLKIDRKIMRHDRIPVTKEDIEKIIDLIDNAPDLSHLEENCWKIKRILNEYLECFEYD